MERFTRADTSSGSQDGITIDNATGDKEVSKADDNPLSSFSILRLWTIHLWYEQYYFLSDSKKASQYSGPDGFGSDEFDTDIY